MSLINFSSQGRHFEKKPGMSLWIRTILFYIRGSAMKFSDYIPAENE